MREILFRGQRVDNGQWVYGMPLESKFDCTYMLTKQGGLNADLIHSRYTILDKKDSIPVISESISQFTGLLDKNGNKIFEGDKVKFHYFYQGIYSCGAIECEKEIEGIIEITPFGLFLKCDNPDDGGLPIVLSTS